MHPHLYMSHASNAYMSFMSPPYMIDNTSLHEARGSVALPEVAGDEYPALVEERERHHCLGNADPLQM